MREVLVIVPAYNEEANIESTIEEIEHASPESDILVINDGSDDKTGELAERPGVCVLSLPFNCGIGAAVQMGFKYAKDNDYQIAVQVDADGQHDPNFIKELVKEIKDENTDMAIGSRFLKKGGHKSSFVRRIGIWIFQRVNSFVLKRYISDNTSGFRAYSKRAIDFLSENYPRDYPEPEAVVILGLRGFNIREIAVTMRARKKGKSSINNVRPVYYMLKVLLAISMNIVRTFYERSKCDVI